MLLGKYDYKYCLGTIERERDKEKEKETERQTDRGQKVSNTCEVLIYVQIITA